MSQKRKRSPSPATQSRSKPSAPETSSATTGIYRSQKLTDRSSTFQALYTPSTSTLPQTFQHQTPEIASASHKILAWRRESNQQTISSSSSSSSSSKKIYVGGHDDDGEKYAGKKVEKVLADLNVTGSCVVARWYGGVMLGPVRFEHIEKVAREAVEEGRKAAEEEERRRRKVVEEQAEREKLLRELERRDGSIEVLRGLALEKEREIRLLKGEEIEVNEDGKTTATGTGTAVQYGTMSLERLRALDKARDATLSFLLKRIDKAEAELKALGQSKFNEIDGEDGGFKQLSGNAGDDD